MEEDIPDYIQKELDKSKEIIKTGKEVKNPSAHINKSKRGKVIQATNANLYLECEALLALYDFTFTEEQNRKYTMKEALSEMIYSYVKGKKLLKQKTHKMSQLPKSFKDQLKDR